MRTLTWQKDLVTHFKRNLETPFKWGVFDCCLFAADCAKLICGKDPAEAYRGTYDSEIGARKALLRNHRTPAAAFGAVFQEVSPKMAQRGDIVVFEGDFGETSGVLWNGQVWAVGLSGLVVVNPKILRAWRVE